MVQKPSLLFSFCFFVNKRISDLVYQKRKKLLTNMRILILIALLIVHYAQQILPTYGGVGSFILQSILFIRLGITTLLVARYQ